MYSDGNGEVSAIHIQRFVGRERKLPIFAGRIFNLPQDDVSGDIHLQRGWNKEFRLGCVRVDVVARRNAKIQVHHGLRGALSRGQRHGSDAYGRSFAWRLRGPGKRGQQRSNEKEQSQRRWWFLASAI